MKRLFCRWFGHAAAHRHFPREYKHGVMHYQCPRCGEWTYLRDKP